VRQLCAPTTTQDLFWIVIPSVARDLQFAASKSTDEKVPDADYQSMRTSLEEEAAAIMAEIARLEQAAGQVA
jgi:hypothetical protein